MPGIVDDLGGGTGAGSSRRPEPVPAPEPEPDPAPGRSPGRSRCRSTRSRCRSSPPCSRPAPSCSCSTSATGARRRWCRPPRSRGTTSRPGSSTASPASWSAATPTPSPCCRRSPRFDRRRPAAARCGDRRRGRRSRHRRLAARLPHDVGRRHRALASRTSTEGRLVACEDVLVPEVNAGIAQTSVLRVDFDRRLRPRRHHHRGGRGQHRLRVQQHPLRGREHVRAAGRAERSSARTSATALHAFDLRGDGAAGAPRCRRGPRPPAEPVLALRARRPPPGRDHRGRTVGRGHGQPVRRPGAAPRRRPAGRGRCRHRAWA